jgi:type II secretion system protein N
MNERIRRILPWVGYPAFYLFALAVFGYLTAPYDRLRHALVAGFNSGDAPLRLELDELSWSWRFPGVSGSGGRLIGAAAARNDPKATPKEYTIDDFHARISVLPLLVGTTAASFGLDAFGGEISGSVSIGSDEKGFETELSNVRAGELPYLGELVGLPLDGTVAGDLELLLPEGQLSKAEGKVRLDIEELALGDGKAKIRGTIALPRIDAGVFTLSATIEEGRVDVEEFSAKGTDLEVIAEGKIRLLDRPETSLVEMDLRFKFSDKYKSKDEMTKALFGAPGSKVPGVFDLDPKIKQAKRDDGFYAWRLTGPLNQLNFQPAASAGTGAAAAAKSKSKRKQPAIRNFASARDRSPAPGLQPAEPPLLPSPPPVIEPPPAAEIPPPPPPPPAVEQPAAEEPAEEEAVEEEAVEEGDEANEAPAEEEAPAAEEAEVQ